MLLHHLFQTRSSVVEGGKAETAGQWGGQPCMALSAQGRTLRPQMTTQRVRMPPETVTLPFLSARTYSVSIIQNLCSSLCPFGASYYGAGANTTTGHNCALILVGFSFSLPIIESFNEHLRSACIVPSSVVGTGNTEEDKTYKVPVSGYLYGNGREDQ